jgi:hypothetical protein
MTKESLNYLLYKWNVMAIALVAMMSIGFSSCGGDDDPVIDERGDFYYQFTLVDRGTLSESEATKLIGGLTADSPTYTASTKADAIYRYEKEVENLRVGFSGNNSFEVAFKIELKVKQTVVKSNVIRIYRSGCVVE